MPTRDEKVTQIEAALRHRFFGLVPKMIYANRQDWTEERHDTDRLSRSLAAYAVARLADTTDEVAADSVIDGPDDGGIDAVHFDRANNRLLVVQAKFKRTGTSPNVDEINKTLAGVDDLLARDFTQFNARFQQRLEEIEDALDTPGVHVHVVVAYLGDLLNQHVNGRLEALNARNNRFAKVTDWSAWGFGSVYASLLAEQTPPRITIDVVLENSAFVFRATSSSLRPALGGNARSAGTAARHRAV